MGGKLHPSGTEITQERCGFRAETFPSLSFARGFRAQRALSRTVLHDRSAQEDGKLLQFCVRTDVIFERQ